MQDMYSKGRDRIQGKSSTSLGVGWRKDSQTWRAYLTVDKKLKNIGMASTEIEAAELRDKYIIYNKLIPNFLGANSFTKPPTEQ